MAARLYATSAVKTKKEACEAAGMNPNGLSYRRWMDKRLDIYLAQIEKQITDGTVDMSQVIQRLGRKAMLNIADLGENAQKEDVRLRANIDLADRSPETAKTHKLQLETDVRMRPEDIARLQATLAESAAARQSYAAAAEGDYVTVSEEDLPRRLALVPVDRSHLLGSEGNGSRPPDP